GNEVLTTVSSPARTAFSTARFCDCPQEDTSRSQYWAVIPTETVVIATPIAGWLFQVIPVSVQEVSATWWAVTGEVPLVAVKFPKRRSFAELRLPTRLRSNFRKARRLKPVLEFLTAKIVSVPKLAPTEVPSRT